MRRKSEKMKYLAGENGQRMVEDAPEVRTRWGMQGEGEEEGGEGGV